MLTALRVYTQHYANGTKTITFSVTGATIFQSHNSQNQKSIAMKNINPTQTAAWQALQKHFEK